MRLLAWFLVVAMVSGNLSQVGYAAQSQTKETTGQRVIKITEKEIERILDRDPERRPELERQLTYFVILHYSLFSPFFNNSILHYDVLFTR